MFFFQILIFVCLYHNSYSYMIICYGRKSETLARYACLRDLRWLYQIDSFLKGCEVCQYQWYLQKVLPATIVVFAAGFLSGAKREGIMYSGSVHSGVFSCQHICTKFSEDKADMFSTFVQYFIPRCT